MNTLKKTLALVATLAMATTAFASCGSEPSSSTTSESKTDATEAATDAPADSTEAAAPAD